MVRFTLVAVVAVGGWSFVLPAVGAQAQEPQPAPKQAAPPAPPPQGAAPQAPPAVVQDLRDVLADIFSRGALELEPAELAGMAAGVKPTVLTLKQAYALAVVRARNPDALLPLVRANLFDAKVLDEAANRAAAADFDRFRPEFASTTFRDPAPLFLQALKHRNAVAAAREQVAVTQKVHRLFDELTRGEASGVSQLQIDEVDHYLIVSRQSLDFEMSSYRSAVDELKVLLGLSPSTPIVLDERILEPFITVFKSVDTWERDPRRSFDTLRKLHNNLPRLDEIKIGGRSLAQVAGRTIPEEEFLRACAEVAGKQRTVHTDEQAVRQERNDRELRLRKLARGLIQTHRNYEVERKGLELAARAVDQRFDQIVAPPAGGTHALAQSVNAAVHTAGLLQAEGRLFRGRTELVSQWLEFKEQSLAFYRELGMLPYDTWDAFDRSFLPQSGSDRAAP